MLVSSSSTAAPAAPRPDRVERVVVFSDRAEVTRTAVARCDGGVAAVVFCAPGMGAVLEVKVHP
jgi:hypothetical protein